jgi:hypothetical protein
MKKLIFKLLNWLYKPKHSQVVQDLLDNNHHYCKTCGELFYSTNVKKAYCSQSCKNYFNNSKRYKK